MPIPARFVLLVPLLCGLGAAQEKAPAAALNSSALQKGQIVPAVRAAAKPEQNYALYVPTNYVAERRWPIIYVFDPGANGSRPLELMKEAAETYGYLLAGSNNSRNGPWQIEQEAAQEMWNDTHKSLAIDDRRIYFAGLSGGARLSAQLAQLCNCARGVFLNSAGFSASSPLAQKPPFAIFAAAGMTDFNYAELTELDAQLESLGARHFFRRFEGGHAWAPAGVWQEALAWSSLLEMKDNLRDRDQTFIRAEFVRATDRLHKREEAGELYFALGEYRAEAALFDGLADTSELKKRIATLAESPAVREGARQEKAAIEKERSLEADIFRIMQPLHDSGGDRTSALANASARIHQLRNDSLKERRPEVRRVLQRVVGDVFVMAMETGGQFLESGQSHTAESYFELGAVAHPDSTWPLLSLAKCHAIMGDKKAALHDLKHAREAGSTVAELAEVVKANPKLAPLIDTPEFQKLVAVPSQ